MNNRYALCVGINDYPGTGSDLNGCVNDALDWSELLRHSGYRVTAVLDSVATKVRILDLLHTMVEVAGFGDRVVFCYSGHGTWVPDRDGDEADGRDEALVCHDFATGGLLLDDELHKVFSGLRYGVGGLILSDSCHSGTMSRFTAIEEPLRADGTLHGGRAPRFLSPTQLLGMSDEQAARLEQLPASTPRRALSLVSGCADEEYSYDAWFSGRANGAFSRAAIDTYAPGIRLGAWHAAIRGRLPTSSYPQSPQLTTTPYRRYVRAL